MRWTRCSMSAGVLAAVLMAAWVSPSSAKSDERARIAAERRALNERHAAEERACRDNFAVTACIDDVRQRKRAALAPLRQQELKLDEAERRQRASDRQAAVEAKRAASAQRGPAPAEPELRVREPARASGKTHPPRSDDDRDREAASRRAQAAARVEAAEKRQAEIAETQAKIAERQARQQAKGRTQKSAPLPLPPGAASAAASAAKRR